MDRANQFDFALLHQIASCLAQTACAPLLQPHFHVQSCPMLIHPTPPGSERGPPERSSTSLTRFKSNTGDPIS